MLDERPAGANECNGDEQQRPFQAVREKIQQAPTVSSDSLLDSTAHSMISCASYKRQGTTFRKFILGEQRFLLGTQIAMQPPSQEANP